VTVIVALYSRWAHQLQQPGTHLRSNNGLTQESERGRISEAKAAAERN
jgi:hypothetical protein